MADWTFERTSQLAPKSRQRVRVTATVTAPGDALNPRNFEHPFGAYYETYLRDGDIWVRRSHHATPPFEFNLQVTSTGDCSYPWLYAVTRTRLVLLFTRGGTDTWLAASDSEGKSWEAPTLSLAGAVKPFGSVCPFDGTEIIAGYVTATGKIAAKKREIGELAYGATYHFKDSAGVDLLFEDDTLSFWWGYRSDNPLIAHLHIDGETVTSTWMSHNCGVSWQRLT